MDTKTPAAAADEVADALAGRLDGQLCFALYSTQLAMNKLYRRLLEGTDLTYPQYLVMLVLWEHDGLTVSELGQRLFLDSATLTPLLKRLEKSGYITRQRATHDERKVEVRLTPAGDALRPRSRDVVKGVFCAAQGDAAQLQVIKDALEVLRGHLLESS